MHPAKSVIFFTVASGAGLGLLFWTAILILIGIEYRLSSMLGLFMPFYLLFTAGLLSSTLHLGHPERAWRALSQWKTSWLSREGVCAIFTYVPATLLAWFWYAQVNIAFVVVAALLTGVMAIATVVCTAMIYASLKPIASWHNPATVVGYIVYALTSGAVLLWWLGKVYMTLPATDDVLVLVLLVMCIPCKYWHWYYTDAPISSHASTATGLDARRIRVFDLPHNSPNYLMKEMMFQVARTRANLLRLLVIIAGFALPAILVALVGFGGLAGVLLPTVAVLLCITGIVMERWLFFAQAFHVVALYYGAGGSAQKRIK